MTYFPCTCDVYLRFVGKEFGHNKHKKCMSLLQCSMNSNFHTLIRTAILRTCTSLGVLLLCVRFASLLTFGIWAASLRDTALCGLDSSLTIICKHARWPCSWQQWQQKTYIIILVTDGSDMVATAWLRRLVASLWLRGSIPVGFLVESGAENREGFCLSPS